VHGRSRQAREPRERVRFVNDLERKLPRRREDERSRRAPRSVDQAMEHGQKKGSRFAATRRGAREEVSSRECMRDGFGLDGCRMGKAQRVDPFDEGLMQLQSGERQDVVQMGGALQAGRPNTGGSSRRARNRE